MKTILDATKLHLIVKRLAAQIIEHFNSSSEIIIIGIQPRGVYLSALIFQELIKYNLDKKVLHGQLDITFYRDDNFNKINLPNKTDILFSIENKKIVIIDDVLFTGRTIRASLNALQDLGRASTILLCVLIDRNFNRELPIQPDFVGKRIDTFLNQKVVVNWQEKNNTHEVILYEN